MGDAGSSGRIVSLLYQPQAMRWRGLTVLTNTPPRGAQSAPGGMQGIAIMETALAKAARKLGCRSGGAAAHQRSRGQSAFRTARRERQTAATRPVRFVKEALDNGCGAVQLEGAVGQPKRSGTSSRGVGVSISAYSGGSIGFDGLFVLKPDGKLYVQSGIGNLGTESVHDVHRVAAEMIGVPWDKVEITWGSSAKNLPWTCVSGGSQTTHAMTRAAHAVATEGRKRLQEIAAKDLGGSPRTTRSPTNASSVKAAAPV